MSEEIGFGKRLKAIRECSGRKLTEAAREMGIRPQAMWCWENASKRSNNPKLSTIRRFAHFYKVPASVLVCSDRKFQRFLNPDTPE